LQKDESIVLEEHPLPTPVSSLAPWLIRGLLAAALLLGGEILLWTDPAGRPLWEWALLILGYLIVATIALDVLVRQRVRDFWGLMTVAGVCGLLIGGVLNPQTGLIDLPRTLVTRVTGAYTLLSLEMLILFLALTGGHLRYLRWALLIGAAAVGLAWGIWVRLSPEQTGVTYGAVSMNTMLIWGAGGALLVAVLWLIVRSRAKNVTTPDLILTIREWAVIIPVLSAILFIRIAQQIVDFTGLVLIAILLALCGAILWFRRNTKKTIILEHHLPLRPLSPVWLLLAVAILFWTGIFAYNLPIIGNRETNQLTVVVYGFVLYGLAWLPTVALVIGVRNYIRQIQGAKV